MLTLLVDNAKLIAGFIISCGTIFGLIKLIIVKSFPLRSRINKVLNMPEVIESIDAKYEQLSQDVARVKAEVLTNGGSSFRDVITDHLTLFSSLGELTRYKLELKYFIADTNGMFTDLSPAMCQLFGMQREQMLGTGWLLALQTDDEREKAWADWMRSVAQHTPYKTSFVIVGADNNKWTISVQASEIRTPAGKLLGFRGLVD